MNKVFTFLIIFFPIFSVYSSGFSNISVADLLMIILFPFFYLKVSKLKFNMNLPFFIIIIFILYLLLSSALLIFYGSNVGILSTIRYILYLIMLVFSFKLFNLQYGIKLLKYTTVIVSIIVIIQFTYFIIFGSTLPWYIPGLNIMDEKFILRESSEYYLTFYRPTGVFLEPTHFAQFAVVYLVYLLFNNSSEKNYISLFLIIIAIICCGSSLGIVYLAFVGVFWLIKMFVYKISPIKIIIILIFLTIMISTITQVDYFMNSINRIFTSEGFNGVAVGYRFDSLNFFIDSQQSVINWVFGNGRSSEEIYFTGIFYFLFTNGILGTILYLLLIFVGLITYRGFKWWLLLSALFLSIGSEFIVNFGILFYLAFVFNSSSEIKEINRG